MFPKYFLQFPAGSEGEGAAPNSQVDQKAAVVEGKSVDEQKADGDSGELDVSKLDPKVQKLIKDLRNENAGSRKSNKALTESHGKLKKALVEAGIIEDDEEAPEEKLKAITAQHEVSVVNNAILETAIEHGVGKDDLKYFRFLVQEKFETLGEDEELDSDQLAELAAEARKRSGTQATGSTSVTEKGKAPAPGATGAVSLDQFVKMNMGEKSELYTKNPATYNQLMAEAKSKKRLL